MPLFDRFKKEEETEVMEFEELPYAEDENKHVKIVIENVASYLDADRIARRARSGEVVIARIKELKESNVDELKQIINKLKTSCSMFDGDIVGIGDEWVLVAPPSVSIKRGE
ncbi:MAG: cell division protein SepF [Candidatus Aenigmarchaeota archaeon]|nr:cell division protein SepF [Candidatus Aenigmarchaeota archaeon]